MDKGSSAKVAGRRTGLAYLVTIIFSAGGYTVLSTLLAGNLQTVLARLAARHALFTFALAASVIGLAAWVVLGFLLYKLMSYANRLAGLLMLIFIVAGTVMSLIALSDLLPLVTSASSGMDAGTLAPSVQRYRYLFLLAQVFSGLWMFPFGWLVLRSHVAPRLLGICLIVGGFSYLLTFATAFEPSLNQIAAFRIVSIAIAVPAMIGELGMCLWLLIKGAPEPDLGPRPVPQVA